MRSGRICNQHSKVKFTNYHWNSTNHQFSIKNLNMIICNIITFLMNHKPHWNFIIKVQWSRYEIRKIYYLYIFYTIIFKKTTKKIHTYSPFSQCSTWLGWVSIHFIPNSHQRIPSTTWLIFILSLSTTDNIECNKEELTWFI